jgi:hypothetical protein
MTRPFVTKSKSRYKTCYDFLAVFVRDNPNEWHKVSPDSLNGSRFAVWKALTLRLGQGDVQIKNCGLDVWARYLTVATV